MAITFNDLIPFQSRGCHLASTTLRILLTLPHISHPRLPTIRLSYRLRGGSTYAPGAHCPCVIRYFLNGRRGITLRRFKPMRGTTLRLGQHLQFRNVGLPTMQEFFQLGIWRGYPHASVQPLCPLCLLICHCLHVCSGNLFDVMPSIEVLGPCSSFVSHFGTRYDTPTCDIICTEQRPWELHALRDLLCALEHFAFVRYDYLALFGISIIPLGVTLINFATYDLGHINVYQLPAAQHIAKSLWPYILPTSTFLHTFLNLI